MSRTYEPSTGIQGTMAPQAGGTILRKNIKKHIFLNPLEQQPGNEVSRLVTELVEEVRAFNIHAIGLCELFNVEDSSQEPIVAGSKGSYLTLSSGHLYNSDLQTHSVCANAST